MSEGISVKILRATAAVENLVTVTSENLGTTQPSGTGPVGLRSVLFFDVSVHGINDGTATVSITNDAVKAASIMRYWGGSRWVNARGQMVSGNSIVGDIPVSALHGTPICIGT